MKPTQTKPSIVFCHGIWADRARRLNAPRFDDVPPPILTTSAEAQMNVV
jgi:hypothetical protein